MQDPSSLYSQIKSQVQHIPSPQFPEKEHLKCPRCDSTNTKFCYYNNYNLSQPRHYCKSCRRYWTKGGVLRNIPVGGGSRKSTKRSARDAGGAGEAAEPEAKRPASAAAVGSKNNSGGGGGEMVSEASSSSLGLKKGETSDVAHFGSLMDASISALLGPSSGGHLGNYVDGLGCFAEPGSGQNLDPVALVSGNGNNNGVEFLNVENNGVGGDVESWRW